jgi:glutamate racemase
MISETKNMGKVVVFDSGLGSLSIIKAIQRQTKASIIYFADQKNYPYGVKTKNELRQIIENSIEQLDNKFNPDLIVLGSNTPSLLFGELFSKYDKLIGVLPPISESIQISKTQSIALLVTKIVAQSNLLKQFLKNIDTKTIKMTIIDSSELVDLVESGKFLKNKEHCRKTITRVLAKKFHANNVDVAMLSSTHLPFLLPLLKQIFPSIQFMDPADGIARQISTHKLFLRSSKNTLHIFTSGNTKKFHRQLVRLNITNQIRNFSIDVYN